MAAAFSSVFAWLYSSWPSENLCMAVAPSSQNLANDKPARHRGSSRVLTLRHMNLTCAHPPSSSILFCAKVSNVRGKLSALSNALVSSSKPLGMLARMFSISGDLGSTATTSPSSPIRNDLNSFHSYTGISLLMIDVARGVPVF